MVDFFTGLQPLEPGETDPARLVEDLRAALQHAATLGEAVPMDALDALR